ncbi:MAG: arginine deiminase-related protein [Actinomycetota bacterium]|nr:arginine deiminase-related protein [Actinomycetota bacterium]
MSGLSWGRRLLMCPPEHFEVLYEINPWMHREVAVDPDRARTQWDALVAVLHEAGADVERIAPVAGLPDMVFTANGGVVGDGRFVESRFRHPERSGESPLVSAWFRARDYEVVELPDGVRLEGAGDALPFGGRMLAGYRSRSDFAAHATLSAAFGVEVLPIELVDPRYYHLDLTFCPLDDRRALVVPDAWDRYGREVAARLVPEPVVLEPDEAAAFCANSVLVGPTLVMPACSARLGRVLEAFGLDVVVVDLGEFLKAGGGVRCLTLALDVALG